MQHQHLPAAFRELVERRLYQPPPLRLLSVLLGGIRAVGKLCQIDPFLLGSAPLALEREPDNGHNVTRTAPGRYNVKRFTRVIKDKHLFYLSVMLQTECEFSPL